MFHTHIPRRPRVKSAHRALLLLPALAVFIVGCGGDDAPKAATPAGPATATPLAPLPTATPVPDSGPALTVAVNAGKSIVPTVSELKAMPTSEINAGGTKKGISIATLAKLVDAKDTALVTIQGVRADGKTGAFVRKSLPELATTTVLVLDAQNHLSIASTFLGKEEWLQSVESVSFINSQQ
jgi:hypothetical protein